MSIYRELRTTKAMPRSTEQRRKTQRGDGAIRNVPDLAAVRSLDALYRSLDLPEVPIDAALGGRRRTKTRKEV